MLLYLSLIENEDSKEKFELLYSTYRQTMFYAANRILKDEFRAEDAVHQAFIRIIDNLEKIGEINCNKTRAFIIIIVEHIAIDIYRKHKKENLLSLDKFDIYTPINNTIEDNMKLKEVINAIYNLPINYSIVLRLKYSHGYNDAEISKFLSISEENVRQRISRAKKQLSQILNKE